MIAKSEFIVGLFKRIENALRLCRHHSPAQSQLAIERNEEVIVQRTKFASDSRKKLSKVCVAGGEVAKSSDTK